MTSLAAGYRETPLWLEGLDFPGPFVGEPLPESVDVVVVGSGFTGVAAARELARRGRSVTVLEKESLGYGASTRNNGQVHPGLKLSLGKLNAKYGAAGKALYSLTVDALELMERIIEEESIECDYAPSGFIYLADGASSLGELRAESVLLREVLGEKVRLLSRSDLLEEVGSTEYLGGLLVERGGGLQPARYLAGLTSAALKAGATFHELTPALGLERVRDGQFLVTTPRGRIKAADVLVATNGYRDGLVPKLRRRIIPIGSYMIATAPLSQDLVRALNPRGRVFFEYKNFLHYWRVSPDDRMVFGGRVSFVPTTNSRAAEINHERMIRVFPQLAGAPVEYAWSGLVGFALDRLPHFGRMGGVVFAMGDSGSGIIMSTYLGTKLGGWLCGATSPPAFSKLRFIAMPMLGGRPWFLPFVGPYYQLQDRFR